MEFIQKIFSSNFMPHGHCYFWKPEIVWTNAISDSIIALAYITIPFTLVYIIRTRKDINFMSLVLLFAVFIIGCGATHVMDVINIWKAFYYLDSSLRVITAVASIGTAIMLVKITPQILVIPNPEVFKKLNEDLKNQLKELEEKERQLREREALLLETQEIGNIGSYEVEIKNGKYIWTPQTYRIFGYEIGEEITSEKLFARIHPEDRHKVSTIQQKAYTTFENINIEYRLLLPDNKVKQIWSRAKVDYNEEMEPVRLVGTVLDLTEEKEAEENLKAVQIELSQAKEFIFLAESVPQLVWTTSPNGKAQYYNNKFSEYTGLAKEEMLELGWTKVLHPNDQERTIEVWAKAINKKEPYQIEYQLRRFDGAYRWFLGKGTPMKDENGDVIKWFGTCTDIHELKLYEEKLLKKNQELTKTNRDLDNFVYTASHDLKAPVTNLEGLINVHKKNVKSKLSDDEMKILDLMDTSISRFINTIKDLTEITKIHKGINKDNEVVSFAEAIDDVKADLDNLIEETDTKFLINLEVDSIYFSRNNFRSIIYNLISNSIKYRSPDRTPIITIRTYETEEYTVLLVSDNGLGFDIAKKELAFSMFRRLHDHVEGTGLGLYMIKRIIEDAGGKIEVESEVNVGSTFTIYFKNSVGTGNN